MAMKMNRNQNQLKMKTNYTHFMVEPIFPVPQMSSATLRARRAVVESYRGPQIAPDDAMLPMPPHNRAQSMGEILQDLRERVKSLKLWPRAIRLLKRRV
ncbi:hypothetical protein KR084_007041 [Drosophila pseudotakahashii]|nr:hypothetical protein KR084_007041 [Drosophila pseudotakahashii]